MSDEKPDLATVTWDESAPDEKPDLSAVKWEEAGQHVAKRLGLGASAGGMGGLPPDVRVPPESALAVAGTGAALGLTLPGAAAATMATLANPWVGAATGGLEGYKRGGILGAAKGAVQGAATGVATGMLGKAYGAWKGVQALKTAVPVAAEAAAAAKAAPVIAEAAQVAKAAPAVAEVAAEAAPAVKAAAKTAEEAKAVFDASKSAAREFAKANSKKMGEKVWMLLDEAGQPLKTLTPDQAAAAARKGLPTTWVKNTWGAT